MVLIRLSLQRQFGWYMRVGGYEHLHKREERDLEQREVASGGMVPSAIVSRDATSGKKDCNLPWRGQI